MDIEIYRIVTLKDLSYKFMMLFNTPVTHQNHHNQTMTMQLMLSHCYLVHSCYRFDTPFNVDLHMSVKPLKNKITD